MTTYFSAKELLVPPTERPAFSDRQAYVCAELSKLAYFRFEGGHVLADVVAFAREVFGDDSRVALLEQRLQSVLTDKPSAELESTQALGAILREADFELVTALSTGGTQAFVAARNAVLDGGEQKRVAFVAFRGTEPADFRDIRTDIRAALTAEDVDGETIEVHRGYLAALRLVDADIAAAVQSVNPDQLFVTGHSLGGALAILYTRLHAASTNGACYTFGAPPVGSVEVQNRLKTPVYEIINEIDIVPRLPNPWLAKGIRLLFRLLRLIAKSVTVLERLLASGNWDRRLEAYIEAMTRYRHPGYRSYLVGAGSAARLRYNVSSYDRFGWWLSMMKKKTFSGINKMVADHMIDTYVVKLREHARKRN